MSQGLTNEIIKYVIFDLNFIKIKDQKFLTSYQIEFDKDSNPDPIYMAQASYQTLKFNLIFSELKKYNELVLLIQLQDCPIYGLFLKINDQNNGFIACQPMNTNGWIPATTYIQATFLAGMEQIKDSQIIFEKMPDGKNYFEKIKSYILYRDSLFEEN